MRHRHLERIDEEDDRRRPCRPVVIYENDWREDRPQPTPEDLNHPDACIIRIVYVDDWGKEGGGW